MYKLCVFDMDGTVVNSIGDIAAAMNRSLESLGHKTYTDDEYCKMVGDGMDILCRRALPDSDEEEVTKLIELYKQDYINHCCEKSYIYDGVAEVIHGLKKSGVKCAILSNKPHDQAMEVADTLFDDEMFDIVLGQTDRFPIKPAPDSLLWMIDELGVEKSEVAYIGDSNVDVRLGKTAGVFTVGVTWGFRTAEELKSEGADAIADTAEALEEILNV